MKGLVEIMKETKAVVHEQGRDVDKVCAARAAHLP
jgi:hypothetical protein